MLRIEGIKCPPGADQGLLLKKAARLLRCKPEDIRRFTVLRRAVDAREGLQLVYTLAVELADEGEKEKRLAADHRHRLGPGAAGGSGRLRRGQAGRRRQRGDRCAAAV